MKRLFTILASFLLVLFQLTAFAKKHEAVAIFAGGCFWCMQPVYDKTPGVIKTVVGYTGGHVKHPSYREVSKGGTGHIEAIKVVYNPKKVSYKKLLRLFWKNIDPTDEGGQFCDRGGQYVSAIFYLNKKQKQLAVSSKLNLLNSGRFKKIATLIQPGKIFYPAEKYHQYYYKKNPVRYKFYRLSCGRDSRLKKIWS